MTGEIWSLLGVNLALVVVVFSLVALPSFRTGDPSYVDGVWGLGFLLVAVSSLLQTDGDTARRAALVGVSALWGLRLSVHLLVRWWRTGPDPRYQALLAGATGTDRRWFLWTRVFLAQAVLVEVVSLPLQLGQVYDRPEGLQPQNVVGVLLALAGIVYESVADLQLSRFKATRTSPEQVLDSGLWRYSRHPNYFGEACTWWGMFLVAVVNAPTAAAALGPLLLTGFLLKWSGVGHQERSLKKTKPSYADYIARTNAFVPGRRSSLRLGSRR
jgi:steroid 5-alpha reductase family enzyme